MSTACRSSTANACSRSTSSRSGSQCVNGPISACSAGLSRSVIGTVMIAALPPLARAISIANADSSDGAKYFAVLTAPDIPSILVETAFISNPQEEKRLNDERYQDKLARAILEGIKEYVAKHPPRPSGPVTTAPLPVSWSEARR